MKVLVNAVPLLAPLTGIGQYTRSLFAAMQQMRGNDDGPESLDFFYGFTCESSLRQLSPGALSQGHRLYRLLRTVLPRPRAIKRLVERAAFEFCARNHGDGWLYHETSGMPHPFAGPNVITIYDLSCFDLPHTHPAERVRLVEREMPGAVERAAHILAISQFTADRLIALFGVSPDRISITPLAADVRFYPRAENLIRPTLAKFGLHAGQYFLSVGTLEPRKNLGSLIEAYLALPATVRRRIPLVLAGMDGWRDEGNRIAARQALARGEIRLLGYVPDDELPVLYAGAAAFIYPSLYEGFGLPPLEAMASGVPVIASCRTALPEVLGDTGLLWEPGNIDVLAEHLYTLAEDRRMAEQLASRGLERSADFSWQRCARQTLSAYRKVA